MSLSFEDKIDIQLLRQHLRKRRVRPGERTGANGPVISDDEREADRWLRLLDRIEAQCNGEPSDD